VVTIPLGTSLFSIQIHLGAQFFEIYSPKDVEVSSPEVYVSVSETFARKKYGVCKTQGGGNHPLSVVRGLIWKLRFMLAGLQAAIFDVTPGFICLIEQYCR